MYRNANDTYRQHSKVIKAIEADTNEASPRMREADNIPTFGQMSADEKAAFRPDYVYSLMRRIEAAASPMTNKAKPLLSDSFPPSSPFLLSQKKLLKWAGALIANKKCSRR